MVEEIEEEQVTIYSLTLISMINNSRVEQAETVVKMVYSKLYKSLSVINSDVQRPKEILDVFSNLMSHYGQFISLNNNNAILNKDDLLKAIF